MRPLVIHALAALTVAALALAAGTQAARADEDVVIHGLVVDEGRHPQQGMSIEVRLGEQQATGATDAEGRYYVTISGSGNARTATASIRTRSEGSEPARGGRTTVDVPADARGRVRAPKITLGALYTQAFEVRGPHGPARGIALMLATHSRYHQTPLRRVRSGPDGRLSVTLPKGSYALVVTDPRWAQEGRGFSLPAEKGATDPQAAAPLRLDLRAARTLHVRVLDDHTGAPLAGASVRPSASPAATPALTDAQGEATLERLPTGTAIYITAWLNGFPAREAHKVEVGAEQEHVEIRLARAPTFTLRWPVATTPQRPADGARLLLRPNRHDKGADLKARVENDEVVLEDHTDDSPYLFAIHEERVAARLFYKLLHTEDGLVTQPQPARFLPTSTVRVRLVDESGAPLAGQLVALEGWYTLRDAEGRLTRTTMARGDPTDASGEVSWEGVFFGPSKLAIKPGPGHLVERPLAEIHPGPGFKQTYEYVVPAPRMVELRVTLDGVPGLRADIDVYCNGHLNVLDADPTTGVIRFPYVPASNGSAPHLSVSAGGYVYWSGSIDPAGKGPIVLEAPLKTTLTLSVVLVPKPTEYVLGDTVQVHRFDEALDRWTLAGDCEYHHGAFAAELLATSAGLPCWRAVRGLTAGRYRLVHVPTGVAGAPFSIDPSKPIWVTRYTLPNLRTVKGRFTFGAEFPWTAALIEDVDGAPGLKWNSELPSRSEFRSRGGVGKDGSFEVEIADGEPARLRLAHPLLQPCTFEIPAELEEPLVVAVTRKIVLSIPCPHTRANLPPHLQLSYPHLGSFLEVFGDGPPSWEMLGAFAGPDHMETAPRIWTATKDAEALTIWTARERVYDAQTIHVGLEQPGLHTIFIDFNDRAPVLIKDLLVREEGLAMGPVPAPRGSRVHVKVIPSPRNGIQKVTAHATPKTPDGPAWSRVAILEGSRPPLGGRDPWAKTLVVADALTSIYGLRAGTYTVRIHVTRAHAALDGAPEHIDTTVTVNGTADVTITADFRTPAEQAAAKKKNAAAPPR